MFPCLLSSDAVWEDMEEGTRPAPRKRAPTTEHPSHPVSHHAGYNLSAWHTAITNGCSSRDCHDDTGISWERHDGGNDVNRD